MNHRTSLLLLLASILPAAACPPDDGFVGTDHDAAPMADAGPPAEDLGAPEEDAGPMCGFLGVACPSDDAGPTPLDAGAEPDAAPTECAPPFATLATCTAPLAATTDGAPVTLLVSTLGHDLPVSCGGAGFAPLSGAVLFHLAATADVTIDVSAPAEFAALSSASECGATDSTCFAVTSGATLVHAVPPGDYVVRVTTSACVPGESITVGITEAPPTPAP